MAHFKDAIKDLMRTRFSLAPVGRLLAFCVVHPSISLSLFFSLSLPFSVCFYHGLVNVGRGLWSSSNLRARVSGAGVAGVARCPQLRRRTARALWAACCCWGSLAHPYAVSALQSGLLFFLQAAAGPVTAILQQAP